VGWTRWPLWKRTLVCFLIALVLLGLVPGIVILYLGWEVVTTDHSRTICIAASGRYRVRAYSFLNSSDRRDLRVECMDVNEPSSRQLLLISDWHDSVSVQFVRDTCVTLVLWDQVLGSYPAEFEATDTLYIDLTNPPLRQSLETRYRLRTAFPP
jgi:hypothetical protein